MRERMSAFLYAKALRLALSGDITGAARYASMALGVEPENARGRRLLALCCYRLGFVMPGADADIMEAMLEQERRAERVKSLINARKYRKALRELKHTASMSVWELTVTGCLYAALGRTGAARRYFMRAVCADTGNEIALRYLRND